MEKRLPRNWVDIRREWRGLSGYERFEAFVAFTLTLVVGIVILVALYRLIVSVLDDLLLKSLNPLEPAVFQHVFGGIMTLLIALEFNHTLRYVVRHDRGIIQAKVVILNCAVGGGQKGDRGRPLRSHRCFPGGAGGPGAVPRRDLLAHAAAG
jgi:hypothetical protein